MFFVHTTENKFKNGILVLLSHGGKIDAKTATSGTATFKFLLQEIVADYEFSKGEATFRIVKVPFFVSEDQIARYVASVLQ